LRAETSGFRLRPESGPNSTEPLVADIHDLMPVILDYARWLGEEPDLRSGHVVIGAA
jgi:hypothetical protein